MSGRDRISELPESLLTQILSHLPTKDSAKTSVLSNRWKNLWLNVLVLDLNCHDFPYEHYPAWFNDVINRYFQSNPQSRMQKLKLNYTYDDDLYIMNRNGTTIIPGINRGIQHLDLECNTFYRDKDSDLIYPVIEIMPDNLYTSKTLVFLKLSSSGLADIEVVSMPCLKFMELKEPRWREPMNLEKLLSGCPVLKELTLMRDLEFESAVTRVKSQSLKRFCLLPTNDSFFRMTMEYTLEIDAPGLEYISLKQDQFDKYVVKNLSSLLMIDLDIKFKLKSRVFDPEDLSKRKEIRDFLIGISNVRHMIISRRTLKVFELYYLKSGLIPKFNNLSRLEIACPTASLQFILALLESCPNLKHLILKYVSTIVPEEFKLTTVPQCVSSSLECVEINGADVWGEDMAEVVSYFLGKSSVLKKLIIGFNGFPLCDPYTSIEEELNKITKLSPTCQLFSCDVDTPKKLYEVVHNNSAL